MLYKTLITLALLSSNLLAESSVWKISSDKHSLYLGGTCHVLRPSDYPLPKEFDEAFENSDLLVLETDMVAMANPDLQVQLLLKGQLPDNKTLKDVLSEDSYNSITAWAKELGFPLFSINRLRPTLVIVSLLSLEFQRMGISSTGVDQYYSDRAVADGKKMDHFETPEEQIDFILNMVPGKEDELVAQSPQAISAAFFVLTERAPGDARLIQNQCEIGRHLLDPCIEGTGTANVEEVFGLAFFERFNIEL